MHALAGNLHSQADLGRVVIHQNNVSGLNSSVTSHGAHRDADIGAHQHGGVVDAITGKGQDIVLALGGQQLFHAVDFIGGQQLGMVFIQPQLAADLAGNGFTVAGQHDGTHALGFQGGNGLLGVFLHFVRDQNRAKELAVTRHINHSTGAGIFGVGNLAVVHHAGVACQHHMAVHHSADTVASNFLSIGRTAGIQLAAGFAQTLADGMAGKAFGQSSLFQQLFFGAAVGRADLADGKNALGQGAGFIKHSNGGVGKCFQIVTALDEDAAAGSAADAAEEAQRNADDQRAGTADNQEGERTADPGQPAAAQHQRW